MGTTESNISWVEIKDNPALREDFIQKNQPFILYATKQISGRTLIWGQDEELSEALIAFNQAIDKFSPDKNVPFLAYARIIIKSRLIDYFRIESKQSHSSLDDETIETVANLKLSVDGYTVQAQNEERRQEILNYAKELAQFDLSFSDLVEISPKHRDTRETLLNAAYLLATEPTLWEKVDKHHKLPMTELVLRTGLHIRVLERGRKYILAAAILIAHQYNYIYLREYVLPSKNSTNNSTIERS